MSLSFTLIRNEKVKHYIRIKTYNIIVLKFWIESYGNVLCDLAQVSLVLFLSNKTSSIELTHYSYLCFFFFFNSEHIKIVKTNPMLYYVDDDITLGETRLSGYTLGREKSG